VQHRTILYSLALATVIALFTAPVLGNSLAQLDPTAQQQTIDAAIGQLFTQTAEAQGQAALTQTIEAGFQQAQTATAAFPTTVQAGFNRALTATAEAAVATQTAETALLLTASAFPSPVVSRIMLLTDLSANTYTTDDLREAGDVISLRLSALGIGGASVEVQQDGGIVVDLPPMPQVDTAMVIETIQSVGLLEFVDFSGLGDQAEAYIGRRIWTTEQEATFKRWDMATPGPTDATPDINPQTNEPFRTVLTGAGLQMATAQMSTQGSEDWEVAFALTEEGATVFGPFTESHIGEPLAIVLDGIVLSAPTIQTRIDSGGVIAGAFETPADAVALAAQLNSGTLPIPLRVESTDIVPVTLTPTATSTPDITATLLAQTVTATPTPRPPNFPTPTTAEINVAEQVFEGGRMLWIQPTQQIWVLVVTATGRGTWTVYDDTFEEGEPEFDPAIVAPADRFQPMRGFGKLWRENPAVRQALGWATTPEFGYVSPYEYHPGGEIVDGDYIPGPGYHVLYSLYGERFRFNETDGTWELGGE
jgi:preprotein translocase subunit SecD